MAQGSGASTGRGSLLYVYAPPPCVTRRAGARDTGVMSQNALSGSQFSPCPTCLTPSRSGRIFGLEIKCPECGSKSGLHAAQHGAGSGRAPVRPTFVSGGLPERKR
jgi:hypothetical protein